MTNLFSKLTVSTLTLALGLVATGCDQSDTDAPTERTARVVMELDGEPVRTWDVTEPGEMQADLIVWGAVASSPDACEGSELELDLVLEQDGEELASFESCAAAGLGDDAQPIDALTASPDPQASVWCTQCDATGDCFSCCKCDGGRTAYCASVC